MLQRAILKIFFFVSLIYVLILSSCTKSDVLSSSIKAVNYYPVSTGKVWIYRLDSTNIPAFGTSLITNSYHIKDSVGSSFIDNTGRQSWVVYRFITDTLEQNMWQSLSSYYVTPTANDVEVVDDNNLRFIKLTTPVRAGYVWQGNTYIDTRSATTSYQYFDGWNYMYTSVGSPYSTLSGIIDSSVTIFQRDETSPEGPFDPEFYQQRNYSVEVYAKGVGLIYKNFLHSVWQPTPEPARYTDDSYGIILNLIQSK